MKLQVASLPLRGNYETGHGGVACAMTGNETPSQLLDAVLIYQNIGDDFWPPDVDSTELQLLAATNRC